MSGGGLISESKHVTDTGTNISLADIITREGLCGFQEFIETWQCQVIQSFWANYNAVFDIYY